MANQKFLQLQSGIATQHSSISSSAGAASAGEIPALNGSGLIDSTMLPESSQVTMTASEAISAGAAINIWNNSGAANVRNADNGSLAKRCHGFAPQAIASSASGPVDIGDGVNSSVSGLTIGSQYFLGAAGAYTTTPPTGTGTLAQSLGVARSATELEFCIGEVFVN